MVSAGQTFKYKENQNTMVEKEEWVVEVPTELREDLESFARQHFEGETWKMLAEALASLNDQKFTETEMILEKVRELEEEIEMMKQKKDEQDGGGLKSTFGPGN
jgi:hypothetical protein